MLGLKRGSIRSFVRFQSGLQRGVPSAVEFAPTHSSPSSISSLGPIATIRHTMPMDPVVKAQPPNTISHPSTGDEITITESSAIEKAREQLELISQGKRLDLITVRQLLKEAQLGGKGLDSQLDDKLLFIARLILSGKNYKMFGRVLCRAIVTKLEIQDPDHAFNECMSLINLSQTVNKRMFPDVPIKIRGKALTKIVDISLQTGNHYDLYKVMLNSNMDVTVPQLRPLLYKLRNGSARDRKLYEWSSLFEDQGTSLEKIQMMRFISSYSAKMIRQILLSHIKQGNQIQASRYLELLIAKYAMDRGSVNNDFEAKKIVTELYEMIGYVAVRLWSYKSVIAVLETMKDNKIPLTKHLYIILMASMREKNQYETGLMLLRELPVLFPDPDPMLKVVIANELLSFIRQRFPNDVRVLLAHFLAVHPDSFDLVNELGIPGLIYNGKVETLETFKDQVAVANLDKYFQCSGEPFDRSLSGLYSALFAHMEHHGQSSAQNFVLLFDRYHKMIRQRTNTRHVDGAILEMFIVNTIKKARKPKTALYILTKFLSLSEPTTWNKQIITYVFYHHGCQSGSKEFVQFTDLMAKYGVVPDFNLLAGLTRKDKERGESWYNRLKAMGYMVDLPVIRYRATFHGWDEESSKSDNYRNQKEVQESPILEEWQDDAEAWGDEDTSVDFLSTFQDYLKSMEVWDRKKQ